MFCVFPSVSGSGSKLVINYVCFRIVELIKEISQILKIDFFVLLNFNSLHTMMCIIPGIKR